MMRGNMDQYQQSHVLDADISKCFDRIDHEALLTKLNTPPPFAVKYEHG